MYKIRITNILTGKEMMSNETYKNESQLLLKLMYLCPKLTQDRKIRIEKEHETEDSKYHYKGELI